MEIQKVYFNEETKQVTVTALVEDMVLTHSQTYYDPPEYGPAICETTFDLDDADVNLDDEEELVSYLYDADWNIVDDY